MNIYKYKYLKISVIFLIITAWIFSGFPRIWQNPSIPPEIQIAFATDTSPTIAGTGANDATVGNQAWTATDEITVAGGGDDGVYADTLELAKNEVSNYLKATNFGFTVPDGSTIQGIKVEIDRKEGAVRTAAGIKDSGMSMVDEAGAIRSTNKADTTNFWPTTAAVATYGAIDDLWGETAGFWTTTKINDPDFGVVLSVVDNTVSGGGGTESAQVDFVRITVTYGPASITVGTTGTQTATMAIPSTNQYVGGAFTFVRSGGTADVTAITISENSFVEIGGVTAASALSNVKLYYKTEANCSASIPGDATAFNATGVGFNASEKAAITGDAAMTVGTSQICVYVQLNVESGAPIDNFFEIEITDPSTEVSVSAGVVSPATAVAISGSTILNLLPNVFQDHYRWRNDDGPENDTSTSVGVIRPNGDVSNQMTVTDGGCTEAWCVLDDSVTQPTAPSTASDFVAEGTDNELAELTMTTVDLAGGTSPSIVVWLYGTGAENVDIWVNDATNGQTTCATNQSVPDPDWVNTPSGVTCTFATALTQTDLDALTLTIRHNQLGGASTNNYYAVYADVNADVTGATWATGAEDQALSTLDKNSNIRLRFQIDNTGGSASAYNYLLEWAAQSGTCDTSYTGESYAAVPDTATTEHFDMTLSGSSLFVDGDPTTAQLSNAESYTFVAGDQVESTSNQSGAITLAQNEYTEVEYVFQANANATDGGVYCFRVTNAGTALDSADAIAQVTLAGGGGGQTLTLTIDSGDPTSLGTVNSGTAVTASTRLKVDTDNATGYLITAGRNNSVNNDTLFSAYGNLTIDDSGIDAHTTACDTTSTWAAASTGLGFTIFLTSADNPAKVESCWGTGTTVADANNKYAAFAASASATTIINQGDNSPNPQYTSIGYKLDVTSAQTATTYNDGQVIFTATTN